MFVLSTIPFLHFSHFSPDPFSLEFLLSTHLLCCQFKALSIFCMSVGRILKVCLERTQTCQVVIWLSNRWHHRILMVVSLMSIPWLCIGVNCLLWSSKIASFGCFGGCLARPIRSLNHLCVCAD